MSNPPNRDPRPVISEAASMEQEGRGGGAEELEEEGTVFAKSEPKKNTFFGGD